MAIVVSGSGFWYSLAFAASFLAIMLAVYVLSRALFRGDHRKAAEKPFFGGNEVPEGTSLGASNVYWGFAEALKRYYNAVVPEHTGNANDYMRWFTVVIAALLIALAAGGFA